MNNGLRKQLDLDDHVALREKTEKAIGEAFMSESLPCILVGGPIQNAISIDGVFDMEIRHLIECVLKALEKANYHVLSSHVYENFGGMDVRGKSREVCARDYQWMQECDLFLAIFPLDSKGNAISTSGTCVELGWASAMGKPIVVVRDSAPKYSHLIVGLDAVTQVTEVYINEKNFEMVVCHAVAQILDQKVDKRYWRDDEKARERFKQ